MAKNHLKEMKRAFLIALAMFILLATSQIDSWLYPIKYEEEIDKYSTAYAVDKAMAESIMRVESKFNEKALSQSGAVGLMQIMPETGKWIAEQLDEEEGNLYDVDRNIRYGVWYIAELTKEFGGNKVLALAAYNAGRGTVWDWIELYGWDKDFNKIDDIPYRETRDYVKRVLQSYDKYKKIFENR